MDDAARDRVLRLVRRVVVRAALSHHGARRPHPVRIDAVNLVAIRPQVATAVLLALCLVGFLGDGGILPLEQLVAIWTVILMAAA